ncbi:MAG: nucleotidyltransferase family protein [Clostridia bacterium]|nr:nucleotidyltransferase family protein [Clostridia bacterium]
MSYTVSQIMLALIRAEICGVELEPQLLVAIDAEMLSELYKSSKLHDMAHILSSALSLHGIKSEIFAKEEMIAVYRHAQFRHEAERIYPALEAAKIPYIPLKGSVIRPYYPRPEQRTSSDIDILVHEEDVERASRVFTDTLGFAPDVRTAHDVSFMSASKTHVELHFDLIEEGHAKNFDGLRAVIETVWQDAKIDTGAGYRYVMSPEMFAFYHIVHMANHFNAGGCGIRPFVDLWIMKHKMGYDRSGLFELLRRAGLEPFGREMLLLSDVWFDGASHTELTEKIERYIIDGGVYGNIENRVNLYSAKRGGGIKFILSRMFLPFGVMKKQYPKLEKFPILLPFYHLRRWCRILFRDRRKVKSAVRACGNINNEKKDDMADLISRLGL